MGIVDESNWIPATER